MNAITIEGKKRDTNGKKAAAIDRKNEAIPCVLYGAGNSISFSAAPKTLRSLIFRPDFQVADIAIDGSNYKAIVKTFQSHPLTDYIIHVDFLMLEEGKKVNVELPLKLVGTPKGVRDGGKLTQKMRKLKVKTTPDKLVSSLDVNVEKLELGSTLRVSDLNIDGVEIMHSESIPLASVFVPRVSREEAAPAAAPKAAAPAAAAPAAAKAPAAKK